MVTLGLQLGRSSLANRRGTNSTGLESRRKRDTSQGRLFAVRDLRQISRGIRTIATKDSTAIAIGIKAVLMGSSVLGSVGETINNGAGRGDLHVNHHENENQGH